MFCDGSGCIYFHAFMLLATGFLIKLVPVFCPIDLSSIRVNF